MSVFSCWPPASGDLMPMEKLYEDILKQLQGIRVHTEEALYQ